MWCGLALGGEAVECDVVAAWWRPSSAVAVSRGGGVGGLRAAVIAAVAGGLLGGVGRRGRALSAGGGWERFELRERFDELGGPGPGFL